MYQTRFGVERDLTHTEDNDAEAYCGDDLRVSPAQSALFTRDDDCPIRINRNSLKRRDFDMVPLALQLLHPH